MGLGLVWLARCKCFGPICWVVFGKYLDSGLPLFSPSVKQTVIPLFCKVQSCDQGVNSMAIVTFTNLALLHQIQ